MTPAWNLDLTLENQPKPRTIIDVGANNSQMTRLVMTMCETRPRILSFEPNPACQPLGERFSWALSDSDGEAGLFVSHKDHVGGTLFRRVGEEAISTETRVKMCRIDDLVAQGRVPWEELEQPILLKVDTEGNELRVLKGFGKLLSDVAYVLVEINNGEKRVGDYDGSQIHALLKEFSFDRSRVLYACYDGPWAPAYLDTLLWRSQKPIPERD